MERKNFYHMNDRTLKYKAMAQSERLHRYLGLPGEYEAMYPQEIVFPNMESGRADDFHTTTDGTLIDLEEESEEVTEDTLPKYGKYTIFGAYMYSRKVYLAVLCHKDPANFPEWYELAPSIYIKIHYYYFTQEELWDRYENLINKVEQKCELGEIEALDIAFVPKFISKEDAPFVTESLSKAFKDAIIDDEVLKRDVGVLLGAMIIKNIEEEKQEELMEDIGMEQIDNKIKKIVEWEYGDKIRKKERENLRLQQKYNKSEEEKQEIQQKYNKLEEENLKKDEENLKKDKENNRLKEVLAKIKETHDLDPDTNKIINALLVSR